MVTRPVVLLALVLSPALQESRAQASADASSETMLYQDLTGQGRYACTGVYLVSSEDALRAYLTHPWSKEGRLPMFVPGVGLVGFGDRYPEFLSASFPAIPPPAVAGTSCATMFPQVRPTLRSAVLLQSELPQFWLGCLRHMVSR